MQPRPVGTLPVVFPGTQAEAFELTAAITLMCNTASRGQGEGGETCTVEQRCAAHRMLLDQKTLGHLVFAKRLATRFRAEEFDA